MRTACTFRFHYRLNDFLPGRKKSQWLSYDFQLSATVKDAIEAIGVPHVEVNGIRVNGNDVSFSYQLEPGDRIEVFPFVKHPHPNQHVAFVLDVHLGKLARLLRLFGFDVYYDTGYSDAAIVAIALQQSRIVLTRDIGLLKYKLVQYGYWLRSQQPEEQLTEVLTRFALCDAVHPFSRCIACNGAIVEVVKERIVHLLPPNTKKIFTEFYQCSQCDKVYWKGSHYENMLRRIEHIRSIACYG
jgi:hypothetical protein